MRAFGQKNNGSIGLTKGFVGVVIQSTCGYDKEGY